MPMSMSYINLVFSQSSMHKSPLVQGSSHAMQQDRCHFCTDTISTEAATELACILSQGALRLCLSSARVQPLARTTGRGCQIPAGSLAIVQSLAAELLASLALLIAQGAGRGTFELLQLRLSLALLLLHNTVLMTPPKPASVLLNMQVLLCAFPTQHAAGQVTSLMQITRALLQCASALHMLCSCV